MTYAHQSLADNMLSSIAKGIALDVLSDTALVAVEEGDGTSVAVTCDLLWSSDVPPMIEPGDSVLVWRSGGHEGGVIVGRIGPGRAKRRGPSVDRESESETAPDELIIEARKKLTLRVGDGSITIREDGKILIQGRDLVSHAQRTNRIKGGAVAIN